MICNYCDKEAKFVTGKEIYTNRQDLWDKKFYICEDCDARVSCHADGTPFGSMATPELRKWRYIAHSEFDPMWNDGYRTRTEAYEWMAKALGIPKDECHISMFDINTCKKLVEKCEEEVKL